MTRRQFGFAGITSASALAFSGIAYSQETRQGGSTGQGLQGHERHADHMRECAKACSDCQRECNSCATHCVQMVSEGKRDHLATLMTCRDCADFCVAAAQIVARLGPFATLICQACAEACARCGKECEKFPNDEHMKRCAEECRKCEKACNDMVKQMGGTNR